jgi:hypothetical protein
VWAPVPFNSVRLKADVNFLNVELKELNYSVKTRIQNAKPLSDAPYRMFCIPYGPIQCINTDGTEFTANATAGLNIAVNITSL